jgi:hypothetical protein
VEGYVDSSEIYRVDGSTLLQALNSVSHGRTNLAQRMKDVHSCLKPGGIVLWSDGDYGLYYTEEFKYVPPASELNPERSRLQRPIAGKMASTVRGYCAFS